MILLQGSEPSSTDGAPEGDAARASGPRSAGEALRRQREALGLDLDEVAAVLRVKARYLAALEAGRPEQLPALAYALGFIRAYANYLGLDPAEVLLHFKEGPTGFSAKVDLAFPMSLGERHIPGGAALLTTVLVAICGCGIWYFVSTGQGGRVERIAPVPAELLARTAAAPPAFGASRPPEGGASGSDSASRPVADPAPVAPAARDATQPRKGHSIHRVDPRRRGSRN